MCLDVDLKKHPIKKGKPQPLITKEDMIVYKRLQISAMTPGYIAPYHSNFRYKQGEHYYQTGRNPMPVTYNSRWGIWEVNKGLHAYVTKKEALECACCFQEVVFEMIIPKGSKHYLGMNGDIVADNLISPHNAKRVRW